MSNATRATLLRLQLQSIEEAIADGDEGADLVDALDRVEQALTGLSAQRHARMLVLEALDATTTLTASLPALSEAMGRTVDSVDEVEIVRSHVRPQHAAIADLMTDPDIRTALVYWRRGPGKKTDGLGSRWVWFGAVWFPRIGLTRISAKTIENEWRATRAHAPDNPPKT